MEDNLLFYKGQKEKFRQEPYFGSRVYDCSKDGEKVHKGNILTDEPKLPGENMRHKLEVIAEYYLELVNQGNKKIKIYLTDKEGKPLNEVGEPLNEDGNKDGDALVRRLNSEYDKASGAKCQCCIVQ